MDLWVSTNVGVSNGNLGFDFLFSNSAYKMCIYIRPRVDLGEMVIVVLLLLLLVERERGRVREKRAEEKRGRDRETEK